MKIPEFTKILDFDSFNYLYHETSRGTGERIMEEDLLVNGNNILNVDNILFTTTLPLTKDMINDPEEFSTILRQEKSTGSLFRDVTEMVIIASPKDYDNNIVSPYNAYAEDENYYQGIVEPSFILGVINLEDLTFTPNIECEYYDDFYDIETYKSHK
jgi:hypothetical protein